MEDRVIARPLAARHWASLVALGAILLITFAWWALALWPLPAEAPPALQRARTICFGTTDNGLPNGVGWMMLTGEPIMITLLLLGVAGSTTIREALEGLGRHALGRVALGGTALAMVAGLTLAGARVAYALGLGVPAADAAPAAFGAGPRLDRPAPPLNLVDQRGGTVTLAALGGRPVLLTFAYAHCETVCPLVVQNVVRARNQLASHGAPPQVVVITLDPWRDTPSRLGDMARQWGLPDDAFVLSGPVQDVEAALHRWEIPRTRNGQNGEITHPNLVYVLDGAGKIAFVTNGSADAIVGLVNRL
jgi:cytochrome oxidase Cu insertion factor (SCO1/SenC/PrrC family)